MIPVVMMSCDTPQKTPVRELTLERLRKYNNITPQVYLDPCTDPSPARVLMNAHELIKPLAGRGVLFLEDDVDVNDETFPRFLTAAINAGKVTTFCLLRHRLYPAWVPKKPSPMPGMLVELQDYATRYGFHGSMALYLPPSVTMEIATREHEFHEGGNPIPGAHGFDFWVKHAAARHGGFLAAIPNPVNHRPGPTSWERPGTKKRGKWQDFQSTTWGSPITEWKL